ncbi:hypothetical protein VY88_14310 [Azospirillum thiophilum]|uniref:Uncharacterized protein n=1 Tax=Azospirillum thiophilum TaxID=528244 RepID=A0AAC8ZUY1_9PROT|nr:hypothetical protein [Azospirillum thiophilum]ALG73043.1 hypothetical protein AL072_19210 [Azospirillum thiophilum]KJR64042.1 hypothetical protein VY88_14310 [Azospirillum thiophilum]
MDFFTKLYTARLYAAQPGAGFFYYVLPAGCTTFPDDIGLQDALTSAALQGSFVYSAGDPNITAATAESFVAAITAALAQSQDSRGFLWLTDPTTISPSTCAIMSLSPAGDVGGPLAARIVPSLSLTLTGGMTVSLDGTTLSLTNANAAFQGSAQPNSTRSPNALLPCDGTLRGTLRFDSFIQRQSLYDAWNWGFQYAFPSSDTDVLAVTALWLPLAVGNLPSSGDMIGFHIAIDPSDPTNAFLPARTTVAFSGEILNQPSVPVALASGFATTTGLPVWLYPVPGQVDENPDTAYLVFNPGCQPDRVGPTSFQAAPAGAYELAVPDAPPDSRTLGMIGGLLGTEYIDFQIRSDSQAGDRLWFETGKAALAPRFPFPAASPVSAPTDPSAPLLESGFVTSWATVVAVLGDGLVPYVAQPKGSPLLGRDPVIYASYPSLFGAMDPAVALPAATSPFPLAPYALAKAGDGIVGFDASQIASFESQVLAATRRSVIGDAGGGTGLKATAVKPSFFKSASLSRGGRIAALAAGTGQDVVTTPSGQLVTLAADGSWEEILLGSNLAAASNGTLAFQQPGTDLQQAFSTGDLFLVIANATRLGSTDPEASGPRFLNGMTIGDWLLTANVGYNSYNDYSNVIIVKGCKGALYDPSSDATKSASLVSSQDKWTMATDFAAPSDLDPADGSLPPGPPDPAELPVLSTWLRSYFQAASEQADTEYFGTFNAIARNPDWTGILILAMDCGLPSDLAGLAAGITDPGAFMAHHLGIEVSPVANDPAATSIALSSSSSMFGLIYYQDPDYIAPAAGQTVTPVPVAEGADYDFRVLTLRVLFENTAVKLFQSYAQVTLNSLFGMPVERMGADGGNDANAVILKGTYVNNNGTPIYSMGALHTTTYYFDNNVFNKVEIDSAQMSTVDDGTQTGILESLFSFSGYLDFKLVRTAEGVPFDVFSFGSPDGQDSLRQGLHYANLGLQLTSPAATPTMTDFRFVTDQITFDIVTSTPRPGCLYTNFALTLNGLTSGSADAAPEASNWLTIIPDAVFRGVGGADWYGLSYRLDMGTPGALAGKAKLTSQLLTAWSTDGSGTDSYNAMVGIQLPGTGGGAKLISLQNVLKLSVNQIWLAYDPDQSSFLLMLTDIALRFLGLLKIPPSGSTLFYLFGNPESGGKPSGLGWYALYNNEPDNS